MRAYDEDFEETPPDLLMGGPVSTDRDDALADLLLELVGGAAKAHAMLAMCSPAEYAAHAPNVDMVRRLVGAWPTTGRPGPRVGFAAPAPKPRRRRR